MPGFDDSSWKQGCCNFLHPLLMFLIHAYVGQTIQNRKELTALSANEPLPGVFVYDLGQNMVGVPRIKVKGKAGQKLRLRFGEMIYPENYSHRPCRSLHRGYI